MKLPIKRCILNLCSVVILLCHQAVFAQKPKLIFALDVIRHGDRTTLKDIPNASHQWEEGHGQLTAKGMQQEYRLGMKLRKRYVEEEKLLPKHYQPNSLYVRSTDVDRTLMSAQSLLLGLYPSGKGKLPHAFQPIPIHTQVANDQDPLLVFTHGERFSQLYEAHVKNQATWKAKDKALKVNYARWSKASGMQINNLRQVMTLGNTLAIYQNNHIKLPSLLTKEDTRQLIEESKWAFCYLFKSKEIANAMGQPLLALIVSYLQQPHHSLKYVLLSGHDSSLLALFSALGIPLEEPPPFAAHVNFSLYEKNQQQYIVISYNDVELNIPACNGTQCHSENLVALAGGNILAFDHKNI